MPDRRFQRLLVIRGGALGDFLLTLPVLHALRGAAMHLEVLAYPPYVELAKRAGLVDAGRSIEYGALAGFFARGAVQDPALRNFFASFDAVLSYLYDPDGIFAANLRAAGVRNLVCGPHRPADKGHAVDQLAAPLAALGVCCAQRAARLDIAAKPHLKPLIAIHPGSGATAKNWPAARWLDLANRILSTAPLTRLAVIGGEADHDALAILAPLRGHRRTEWWVDLPLPGLAAELAGAQAYLGHDTGVSHLATALGVRSLLLFGPTDPAVWAPPHTATAVIRAAGGDLTSLAVDKVFYAAGRHFSAALLATGPGEPKNPDP